MSNTHLNPESALFPELTDYYLKDEASLISELYTALTLDASQRRHIEKDAAALVSEIRCSSEARSPIDNLLQEYGLSTEEGITLMRLSEALVRTPDYATSRALIRDKIGGANWAAHADQSNSFLVNQATLGLRVTSSWISATGGTKGNNLLAKLGDKLMHQAMFHAMYVMGNHFVLGQTIEEAFVCGKKSEQKGFSHSYDMLGEAAQTFEDAQRYFESYHKAVSFLAQNHTANNNAARCPGLSVKLSALHPRYEYAQHQACIPILTDRLIELCRAAAEGNLWLNIDAEEADRLELSLKIFQQTLKEPSLKEWPGFGIVVQAYQRRAIPVLDHLVNLAKSQKRRIAVRLVKGAYWDMEIKRAQELGLADYPVMTRKENTDLSYIVCAQKLLCASDQVFPQFATHNANTAISIAFMAGESHEYELQRLHGMAAALHERLASRFGVQSRIYAPVGSHRDLLPYLVRRLLENGANGSFVHQMLDDNFNAAEVAQDPVAIIENNSCMTHPNIPKPIQTVDAGRHSAIGIDLTQSKTATILEKTASSKTHYAFHSLVNGKDTGDNRKPVFSPQQTYEQVGMVSMISPNIVDEAVTIAAKSSWLESVTVQERAKVLQTAADLLEEEFLAFLELCVREAGKTLPSATAEIREAVDFCRFYALQAQSQKILNRCPLGVVACISPWNFPLAIFLGQVVAALSVGNTVVAKPAPQTPMLATKAVQLLYRAGVPGSALQLLLGDGVLLGNAITRHPYISGICFTGSTQTAKRIAENLVDSGRPDTPLIAETGGINAMIVDSTALLEQAVKDVLVSAFDSAGQRCSACRIVCVQMDIANDFIQMLTGAMQTLVIGNPAKLSTDIGPVIDQTAYDTIESYKVQARNRILFELKPDHDLACGYFSGPALIEVEHISEVRQEVFGPVLHLIKFKANELNKLIDEINSLGFGLTLGFHTRLDDRIDDVAARAKVGNLYINRNQIGAVVGVNPFGGERWSGTGPKAGGPHYLLGLTRSNKPATNQELVVPSAAPFPDQGHTESEKILANANTAAQQWQNNYSLDERLEFIASCELSPASAELAYDEETALSGPTGETNILRLCPRQTILCFGGDTAQQLKLQSAKSLVTGSAIIIATDNPAILIDISDRAQLPTNLIQWVSRNQGIELINLSIDGVAADGHIRQLVASKTCLRKGPILTVLSGTDPVERFLYERTLTINTTAAGGNASLLAMS